MKTLVTTHGTITVPANAAVPVCPILHLITPAIHRLVRGEKHKFSVYNDFQTIPWVDKGCLHISPNSHTNSNN